MSLSTLLTTIEHAPPEVHHRLYGCSYPEEPTQQT